MANDFAYQIWENWRKNDKTKVPYEKFLMRYFPQTIWAPSKKRLDVLMQNIDNGDILDAGCGTGWATLYLFEEGRTPFSVDLSKEAIKECRQIMHELGYKGNFFLSSITDLPFSDFSFRTVFSFDVLEHVTNIDKALLELNRVLEDNGRLILTIPNKIGLYAILKDYIIKPIAIRLLVSEQQRTRYLHVHLHGLKWWLKKFYQNNFKLIKIINLEFLSPLFALFGYNRTHKLSDIDSYYLSDKISPLICSEWVFILYNGSHNSDSMLRYR